MYRKKRKERKILQKFSDASPDFVAKLDLRLPPNGIFDEGKELSQFERELVGKQLQKKYPTGCSSRTSKFAEVERIEKLREKIVADYTGNVFLEKLPPNPGPRGRYGVA